MAKGIVNMRVGGVNTLPQPTGTPTGLPTKQDRPSTKFPNLQQQRPSLFPNLLIYDPLFPTTQGHKTSNSKTVTTSRCSFSKKMVKTQDR